MSYKGRIPVPGCVTSKRTTSHQDRAQATRRREEQKDEVRKQKERDQEAAKILAAHWAEVDRRKSNGEIVEEPPRSRVRERSRRRRRDDSRDSVTSNTEGDRRTRRDHIKEEQRARSDPQHVPEKQEAARANSPQSHVHNVRHRFVEEEHRAVQPRARAPPKRARDRSQDCSPCIVQKDAWQDSGSLVPPPVQWLGSMAEERAPKLQAECKLDKERPSSESKTREKSKGPALKERMSNPKLKGIFSMGESDDEKDDAREKQLAKRQRARVNLALPTNSNLQTPCPPQTAAAVHMKVARWKASMNGKVATMPVELQREVAMVMGTLGNLH